AAGGGGSGGEGAGWGEEAAMVAGEGRARRRIACQVAGARQRRSAAIDSRTRSCRRAPAGTTRTTLRAHNRAKEPQTPRPVIASRRSRLKGRSHPPAPSSPPTPGAADPPVTLPVRDWATAWDTPASQDRRARARWAATVRNKGLPRANAATEPAVAGSVTP